MQRTVRDYFDRAELASSPGQLGDAVGAIIRLFDFHSFAFLALSEDRKPLLISDYDKRWTGHYVAQGYQKRDPVILHSRHVFDLFVWSPQMAKRFGAGAREFFHEAEEFDIRCGVTVPIHDWPGGLAAMTFSTRLRQVQLPTCLRCNGAALLFITYHFQRHLRRLLEPVQSIEGVDLTRRELECLEWASRGKSRTDIALITGLSYRKVVRDLENIKAKLGVRTTTQAVRAYAASTANRGTT